MIVFFENKISNSCVAGSKFQDLVIKFSREVRQFSKKRHNKGKFPSGRGFWRSMKLGSVPFNILAILLVVVAVAFYLVQVNKTAAYGFRMRETKKELAQLERENERLGLVAAGAQSIARVEEAGMEMKMTRAGRVSYVKAAQTSMAAR